MNVQWEPGLIRTFELKLNLNTRCFAGTFCRSFPGHIYMNARHCILVLSLLWIKWLETLTFVSFEPASVSRGEARVQTVPRADKYLSELTTVDRPQYIQDIPNRDATIEVQRDCVARYQVRARFAKELQSRHPSEAKRAHHWTRIQQTYCPYNP